MIVSHKEVVQQEIEVIERVICDCCGEELIANAYICNNYLMVDMIWGYGSRKENERHIFCVCEDCYDKWVNGFKYKPVNTNNTYEEEDYNE